MGTFRAAEYSSLKRSRTWLWPWIWSFHWKVNNCFVILVAFYRKSTKINQKSTNSIQSTAIQSSWSPSTQYFRRKAFPLNPKAMSSLKCHFNGCPVIHSRVCVWRVSPKLEEKSPNSVLSVNLNSKRFPSFCGSLERHRHDSLNTILTTLFRVGNVSKKVRRSWHRLSSSLHDEIFKFRP